MNSGEFIRLYERELKKLYAEVAAYNSDDEMWVVLPGTINSGGNLTQHLIGNLKTYIGLALGKIEYVRDRNAEFEKRLYTKQELLEEVDKLRRIIEVSLESLTDVDLREEYSHEILNVFPSQSISTVLTHLLLHLSYHTGQINYHRRFTISHEK